MSAVLRAEWVASVSTGIAPDDGNRLHQNAQIQPQRPVLHIGQVELDTLAHGFEIVAAAIAVHLSPTRDAGFHLVSDHVARNSASIVLIHGHRVGPRPDNAHAAFEYIE